MGDDTKWLVLYKHQNGNLIEIGFCDEAVARRRAEAFARAGIAARLVRLVAVCSPSRSVEWTDA